MLNAPSRSSTIVITLHIMEKFNISYSKKNIPTTSIAQYKLMLTSKIESYKTNAMESFRISWQA